jgi:NAD(P)H-hydrate epimerase
LPIVAVDTPSGLNNDTGEVEGVCVRAGLTASLALPKIGQYFYPGHAFCGQVRVVDIGMPAEALAEVDSRLDLVTASLVAEKIPDRQPTCHKGDCGKLFILGGSVGMTGAATLAAESAVKSGSGLVHVGIPRSLNDILEAKLTEALTKPLPELRKARALPVRALGPILENIRSVDACCLGPGVGRHFETVELFRRLIANLDRPAVLDADGLYPFSGRPELLRDCKASLVLTPHAGEFARLSGVDLPKDQRECIAPLVEYSRSIGKVVLLKGAPTLICSPEGDVYLSPTGNPGMATGGSGDVLTGVIGSLLGLGLSALDAALCGAYIHGLAGDLAQDDIGTFGLSASDICHCLPEVFLLLKDDISGTNF